MCRNIAPGEDGTGLVPIVPTGELLSVVAVPFPAERDPAIIQLPVEELKPLLWLLWLDLM